MPSSFLSFSTRQEPARLFSATVTHKQSRAHEQSRQVCVRAVGRQEMHAVDINQLFLHYRSFTAAPGCVAPSIGRRCNADEAGSQQ